MRIAIALLAAGTALLGGGCAAPSVWDADRLTRIAGDTSSPTIKLWGNAAKQDDLVWELPTPQALIIAQASAKMQAQSGFHVDRHLIANTEELNAFATTNKGERVIVINLGMVKALGSDEDAWAGLLGHEIAHHVKGHGATRGRVSTGAQVAGQAVATAVGFIPLGGPIASLLVSSVAGTATQMAVFGSYTRPQEEEADALGLQWMVGAGYDPAGMLRLMQTLAQQSKVSLPAFLSTHPGSDERIKNVEAFIASRATGTQANLQPAAVRAEPNPSSTPQAAQQNSCGCE